MEFTVETSKENADTDTEMQFLETNNNIYDNRRIEIVCIL